MGKKEFLELLDKYLAGKASAQEEQLLLKLYKKMEAKNALNGAQVENPDIQENKLIEKFTASIKKPSAFHQNIYFRFAACLLVVFSITAMFWTKQNQELRFGKLSSKNLTSNFIRYTNNTSKVKRIMFPDGSYVDLAKNSKIGYGKTFTGTKREVYLTGEGFFEVTKDRTKPFIVYAYKIVVKVLGTSFLIKGSLKSILGSVLVKTGKVSVYKRKDFSEANAKPELTGGLVLIPNHMATLNDKEEFEKNIPKKPELLKNGANTDFNFSSTPIATVFSRLQAAYGINILYDKEKFARCSISVNMGNETFYEKLNVVCHTLNMKYEVHDGDVWIEGPGCGN